MRLSAVSLALLLGATPAATPAAEEGTPEAFLAPSPEASRGKSLLIAGGLAFPIVGTQGVQPEAAAYADLPGALQAGLKLRLDVSMAEAAYDYIPQAALQLRKLWISDQDTSTVRNSEYVSLAFGGYPAYGFDGRRAGLRPCASIQAGKYWMPFENQPFGLDFTLEFTRYFYGHPPDKDQSSYLTAGVNLFRQFRLK